MDSTPLVRLRWRLKGAWMWPSFVALTLLDAVIAHALPFSGDSTSLVAGWLISLILNLLAIIVLTGPVARVVGRVQPDMPRLVARDYAGTMIAAAVTLSLLSAGLIHRESVDADRAALADAVARAESYIGTHAPAGYQENLDSIDTYVVQARSVYRTCVTNPAHTRDYCVVVNREQPLDRSVHYSGSEPNGLLAQGTN